MREKLVHLVTQWDMKQAKRKHYNPYALAQYLEAVDSAMGAIDSGSSPEASLRAHFNDRLLTYLLKGIEP